jgi:hypothetical protein
LSPKFREAFSEEDAIKGLPTDRVESFPEVQLEDCRRSSAPVAGLDDVSRIDEVFRNRAARDKPCLVWVDKEGDKVAEAQG